MEKIKFMSEEMQEVEFFILEQTMINGMDYILVADSEDDEAQCLILKETSKGQGAEAIYEIVDDDVELNAVSGVFEELLEDVEIER